MADLSTKRRRDDAARERMREARENGRTPNPHEPLWQQLGERAYLGYRVTSGAWIARYGEPSPGKRTGGKLKGLYRKGKHHFTSLTDANGVAIPSDDYLRAKKTAEEWLAKMTGRGGVAIQRGTVRDALAAYVADLRETGRETTATEAESRFKTTVWDDPLADVRLESLTKDTFRAWRKRQMDSKRREDKKPGSRSVNRQVRAVVAALNYAVTELNHVGNPAHWKLKPLADDAEDEGEETAVFLSPQHRAALIAAAAPRAATFLRALELTGARPKELANATVGDLTGERLRLKHRKGRPPKLRVRYFELDEDALEFFTQLTKDRAADAWLLTEDEEGEQPWRRHKWARAFNAAAAAVNKKAEGAHRIPEAASCYSFRHSYISEQLQIQQRDPLSVGHQTGTSIAMIERAYFRFIPSATRRLMKDAEESGE
jgi:integrase